MEVRAFGSTDLRVSVIGFGAWAIGGPAMAGTLPIGWGKADDTASVRALQTARDLGITFYDTADFYGLGHSEELIGEVFGNSPDIAIATKVGQRLTPENTIAADYSKRHIISACEASLRRLKRERIDLYQLHSAKLMHLQQGECVEAMEQLRERGDIRFWGVSLNTFHPEPEAEYMMTRKIGNSVQLVLNILNQRAVPLLQKAAERGYGVIARMPLQFGLLTGKFTGESRFGTDDHRSFRLTPEVLEMSLGALEPVWPMANRYGISKNILALSYCASAVGVSTIIPGIKTPAQARANTTGILRLSESDMRSLAELFRTKFVRVVDLMEAHG